MKSVAGILFAEIHLYVIIGVPDSDPTETRKLLKGLCHD